MDHGPKTDLIEIWIHDIFQSLTRDGSIKRGKFPAERYGTFMNVSKSFFNTFSPAMITKGQRLENDLIVWCVLFSRSVPGKSMNSDRAEVICSLCSGLNPWGSREYCGYKAGGLTVPPSSPQSLSDSFEAAGKDEMRCADWWCVNSNISSLTARWDENEDAENIFLHLCSCRFHQSHRNAKVTPNSEFIPE